VVVRLAAEQTGAAGTKVWIGAAVADRVNDHAAGIRENGNYPI
jgi:hypothetical protein